MARVRLTKRTAAADKTPYPGTVNQERNDPEMNQYDNFEHTVNHELPDMRTEWKNDQRNEIGVGIPTVASIRASANRAVKLAVLLLGEKAPEKMIEAQARDFMALGGKALNASLARFAETEELYAADEDSAEEPKAKKADDEKKEEEKPVAASKKCVGCKAAEGEAPAEEPKAKKAEEAPKEEEKPVAASKNKKAEEEKKDEEPKAKKAGDEEVVEAEDEMDVEAEEEEVTAEGEDMDVFAGDEDADMVESASKKADDANELDVELTAEDMDGETKTSAEEDELLASLYAGEAEDAEEAPKTEAKKASTKKGVKKLGGQPKVASTGKGGEDLSNLWKSAPDLSSIF